MALFDPCRAEERDRSGGHNYIGHLDDDISAHREDFMIDIEGKGVYQRFYDSADGPEDLPWHRDSLPPLLHAFLANVSEPKSILDLGSGAGLIATALAERGHDVVGVDFVEDAIEASREHAAERGVDVEFVHADVVEWEAPHPFDIVLDYGLYHDLDEADAEQYRDRLYSRRLADDGDYFLTHFTRRNLFDWRPIGPHRRSVDEIVETFEDELSFETVTYETISVPIPVGPTARYGHLWFSRTPN